jgi:acetolactate synthase I/III small subunit
MTAPMHETDHRTLPGPESAVLEVTLNNHTGVMPHVCSLFARRAYHVRGMLWLPSLYGTRSRVWLLVGGGQRLEQIAKQIGKLEDVQHVRWRSASGVAFTQLEGLFRPD